MNLPRCSSLLSACLLAAAAGAPAAALAALNDATHDKAVAEAAAMERAQRLAANPMRVILEASRVRRRANGEPLPAVAAAVPLARAEVTPRARPARPPREVATPQPTIISPDLAQALNAPVSEPAFAPEPVAQPVTASVPAQVPMTAPTPEPTRPTLITRVDPDPPARLLTDFGASSVITADLTIKPDGSVSQVVIVTPNTRSLGRYVVTALRQWRFAPLPSERVWRVEVVFRTE